MQRTLVSKLLGYVATCDQSIIYMFTFHVLNLSLVPFSTKQIQKIKRNYHDVGDLLNSLGIIHAKRRSYKRAMKCFVDSLKVRRTVMGEHHEDVGETLHNMGNCAAKQMDYDKALECYEKSLIIKRLTFGECSIASANTLQNIGYVNEELGLLDHSLNYYKDALAVRSMLLGEHHIDVAFSLHR